jgi:hypothetical protein
MPYDTPQAAATANVPPGEVRVLDVSLSPHKQYAVVLIEFGQAPSSWVMESLCTATHDKWDERSTEEQAGWSWLPTLEENGVITAWTADTAAAVGFGSVRWDVPPPAPPPFHGVSTARW